MEKLDALTEGMIRSLVVTRRKLQAVKLYRTATGADLEEAVAAVNAIEAAAASEPPDAEREPEA